MPDHEVRFCTALDGVRIAYTVSGEGPPLVNARGWLSQGVDVVYSGATLAFHERLMQGRTYVMYDPRGLGASERDIDEVSPGNPA